MRGGWVPKLQVTPSPPCPIPTLSAAQGDIRPSRIQPRCPSAGSKMEQLSGLQLQKLILNKGGDCRNDWGRESKGEGGKGQKESGLIVAAAAVGGLPRRWGDRGRQEKAERGLFAHPWVHLSPLLLLLVACLPLFLRFRGCLSASLPVSLSPVACGSASCLVSSFPISLPGSLCLSVHHSAWISWIPEPPRLSLGAAVIIIRSS